MKGRVIISFEVQSRNLPRETEKIYGKYLSHNSRFPCRDWNRELPPCECRVISRNQTVQFDHVLKFCARCQFTSTSLSVCRTSHLVQCCGSYQSGSLKQESCKTSEVLSLGNSHELRQLNELTCAL
jgi:hypothetical protein